LPNESITEDFKACADVAPGGSGQLVEVTSGTLMLLGIAGAAALGAKANDEASDCERCDIVPACCDAQPLRFHPPSPSVHS